MPPHRSRSTVPHQPFRAHIAPHTLTLGGFGWRVSPPLILALGDGTVGWILGAILGFGPIAYESKPPGAISLQAPVVAVSVVAPSRLEESRAILRAAGAHVMRHVVDNTQPLTMRHAAPSPSPRV